MNRVGGNAGNALVITLVIGLVLLIVSGCGYLNPSAVTAANYIGSGSDWSWALNSNNSFVGTESSTNSTITGTFVRDTGSGFWKGNVTGVTGTANPALISTTIGGLEISNFLFLVQPLLTTETQILANVNAGTCPSSDYVANYLYLQFNSSDDMTSSTRDYFGQYQFTASSGTVTTSNQYDMSFSSVSAPATFPGACTNGTSSGSGYKAYLSGNAGVIKLVSPNTTAGDGMLAIGQVALGSIANLNGNYNGFLYNEADSTSVRMMQGSISGATFSANSVLLTDFLTADGAVTATVTLGTVDSPLPGLITGTIQLNASGTSRIACLASSNVAGSGKNVLFCVGQNPSIATVPLNLILVSH